MSSSIGSSDTAINGVVIRPLATVATPPWAAHAIMLRCHDGMRHAAICPVSAQYAMLCLMADENRDQRIPILLTPSELERLDDWMFGRRIRSRGEAIRQLMEFGYQHEGAKAPRKAKSDG